MKKVFLSTILFAGTIWFANSQCHDFSTGSLFNGEENSTQTSGWTTIDGDTDGNVWFQFPNPDYARTGTKYIMIYGETPSTPSNKVDDWYVSKCLTMNSAETYRIEFYYRRFSDLYPGSNLRLLLLSDVHPDSVVTVINDFGMLSNNNYERFKIDFNVPSDRDYYIGFHTKNDDDAQKVAVLIDDILFSKLLNFDANLTTAAQGTTIAEYSQYPLSLIPPFGFYTEVRNDGISDLNNVKLQVQVKKGTTVEYDQMSTPFSLIEKDSTRAITIDAPLHTFTSAGDYDMVFDITMDESDENTLNNTFIQKITITDTIWAVDNGVISSAQPFGTSTFGTDSQLDGFTMANLYQTFDNVATVTSISVYVHSSTANGAVVRAVLFEDQGAGTRVEVIASDFYTTVAADKNGFLRLNFLVPYDLEANKTYYAAIETYYQTSGNKAFATLDDVTSYQGNPSSEIFIPIGGTNPSDWYNNGNAFFIRLNLKDPNPGIKEKSVLEHLFTVSPNPSSSKIIIANNENINNYQITVQDVLGKTLITNQVMNRNVSEVDLSTLANGIYFVNIKSEKGTTVKKVVLSK